MSKRKEVIIRGNVRTSKSGSKYVMSKTFSIPDTIRDVSRYVSFVMFTDKKDPDKRTIYISESDRKFLPREEAYKDTDAMFVSAKVQQSKSGLAYTRSATIDLEEVRSHLGTDYAFIMVTRPKNPKSEEQRTIVIKTSSAKYMPGSKQKTRGGGYSGREKYEGTDGDDDVVI